MQLEKNNALVSLISNKHNTFIAVSNLTGKLIIYKSLKRKKTKDITVKLTWGFLLILKKLRNLKLKFIVLHIQNLKTHLIQHVLSIFKTWNINISFMKTFISFYFFFKS